LRFLVNALGLFLLLRLIPFPGSATQVVIAGASETVTLRVSFSEFVKNVKRNDIAGVVIDGDSLTYALRPTSDYIKAFKVPKELHKAKFAFETVRPSDYQLPYDQLIANNVNVSARDRRGSRFTTLLGYAIVLVAVITVFNRLQLKLPQRGAGRRRDGDAHLEPPITFDDVAGVDEAKEELQEIVEYLKDPERFARLGARPPRGVLLVGPPGTGKTLLAKAIAGEAGVPFFSISASEFVELYVGMGALRVRELFDKARREAPAIVFIDEIDAVAKGRDARLRSVGNDEREQTLNQLLTELDGFDTGNCDAPVICIAATNRPDVLDAALLRPGRFDRRVPVERPDRQGRRQILNVHIVRKGLPLAKDVAVESLASQTVGFTGADLANVVNEAALLAGREGNLVVSAADFDAAIMRSVAGLEKKRSVLRGAEKACVARHELGHALVATAVAKLVPTTNAIEKLSIIPRSGGSLGFTYAPPTEEDRALLFEDEIRGQLAMLMGGRAAEAATSPAVSTGAADDIRRATDLAHRSVAEFGLSAAVGPLSVSSLAAGREEYAVLTDSGGGLGHSVETEVRRLLEAALKAARDTVEMNSALHAELSKKLESEERLEGVSLRDALAATLVPPSLREFVLTGVSGESLS